MRMNPTSASILLLVGGLAALETPACALPVGRAWSPMEVLRLDNYWLAGPRLQLVGDSDLRLVAAGITAPQSIVRYRWNNDRWHLDQQLLYGSNFLWPFLGLPSEEHLLWKGITPAGPYGNDSYLLYLQTIPGGPSIADTLALSRGSSFEYAGAASARYRWAIHDDSGNLRLFRAARPVGPWQELPIDGNGAYGVTIAALNDSTALAVWCGSTLSGALIHPTSVEPIPMPPPVAIVRPTRPHLRARPSGGQWLTWGTWVGQIQVACYDGSTWGPTEEISCAYIDSDPKSYSSDSPDPSIDGSERPVIAWSAYSTRTGRNSICVSCPTDSGFGIAEELPQIDDGFLASPTRDENGDVWLAWWKYGDGAFWVHSYTTSVVKEALVDGVPSRRRVAWSITDLAPKSWWSILRAEGDSGYSVVGRVQAGVTHDVEWTDSTAQNIVYRYRIRRDCKDTAYELLSEPILSDPVLIGVDPAGIAWLPIRLSSEGESPVRGRTIRLRLEGAAAGAASIGLYDVRGRLVGTARAIVGPTGVISLELAPQDSRAGLYFARATDVRGRQSGTVKIILL